MKVINRRALSAGVSVLLLVCCGRPGPKSELRDAGPRLDVVEDAGSEADAGTGRTDAGSGADASTPGVEDAGADGGGGDAGSGNEWTFYRYDVLGHSDVIVPFTTAQAATLALAWTFNAAEASYANPIVVEGVAYFAWTDGTLKAVDVATGSLIWSQPIGIVGPDGTTCVATWASPIGAPAILGDTIFASGGDVAVYALDRQTGTQIWRTSVGSTDNNDFLWTSVFPLNQSVYVGVATLDEDDCPNNAEGRVIEVDQTTGTVTATWWVTDHQPGGGVWTQPVYDAVSNRLFVTTGNSVTTAPYAQAVVALDPDSLDVLDSYQVVATSSVEDYDFGASPTLIDIPSGEHVIVATNKDGVVYALDRDNLAQGLLWQYAVCAPGTSPDMGSGSIVSAAYSQGAVYVAGGATADGDPGAVVALDPATGNVLWQMHPDGFVLPALVAVGDVLIACASHLSDMTGRIYVLDQSSGDTVASFSTAGVLFAPPSFAENTLFVPDGAGNVYAYRVSP